MAGTTDYIFKIDGLTPETMPLGRLLEYYGQLNAMLGLSENIHLTEIFHGSHGSAFRVDEDHRLELNDAIAALRNGTAPEKAKKAQAKIDEMLGEDGTSGSFSDPMGTNIIQFPGKRVELTTSLRIRDSATFMGELYHIGGTMEGAMVKVKTSAYGMVSCKTTRDMARKLRDSLFDTIKVSGYGVWYKNDSGEWRITDFCLANYMQMKEESVQSALAELRTIEMNWPEDPIKEIEEAEKNGGQLH